VGSSQNCALPTTVCNTIWAAGVAHIATKLESGMSLRDVVAETFKESRSIIFTGNGYSKEWVTEAQARGLPNLNTTPLAIEGFNSSKGKKALMEINIFSEEECEAVSETMYENYNATLTIEVETMLTMVATSFIPAMAKDLAIYKDVPQMAGERSTIYTATQDECKKLRDLMDEVPDDLAKQARYLCDTVKPQMAALRKQVDAAEKIMEASLYPFPTYEELLYGHHF
jgi:glutamine synthetase